MPDTFPDTPRTPTSPQSSPILFGPHGLRAGWSLLVAVTLFFTSIWAMTSLLHATRLVAPHAMERVPGPLPVFIVEAVSFLAIALVTWIMSRIEQRPVHLYGLGGVHKTTRFLVGVLFGLLAISLLILILLKANLLAIDRRLLTGSAIFRYALLWIPGFLAIGFFEEYLFRGYLQYTLARGLSGIANYLPGKPDPQAVGFWISAFLVSFGFGAVHGSNPGESPAGLVCAGLASLIFCFSLWRTGSLWWAIGLHAAWDYGQSFLYGVADSGTLFQHRLLETHPIGSPLLSGGTTGPEGSILCLIPLLLLAAAIHFTQPRSASSYASLMPTTQPTSTEEVSLG
ncbi:CPBP family intramembrane glutamic endopeptidase [Edaphobacter albus]|uniref:CPBP family intramembrane glutamic endopeptidase n=1 Tax=Edaphobacter sp. 4G125 TaxID=2763071 RepID=UPI0016447014|nr:type II CAAX endopeptidase family protein [Edaphobacter sp. 4G125]QNI37887.1 CPBP family intramembrane metalloprotease [Edaphobacter sp. 4G125]